LTCKQKRFTEFTLTALLEYSALQVTTMTLELSDNSIVRMTTLLIILEPLLNILVAG